MTERWNGLPLDPHISGWHMVQLVADYDRTVTGIQIRVPLDEPIPQVWYWDADAQHWDPEDPEPLAEFCKDHSYVGSMVMTKHYKLLYDFVADVADRLPHAEDENQGQKEWEKQDLHDILFADLVPKALDILSEVPTDAGL